jgi:putative transposase
VSCKAYCNKSMDALIRRLYKAFDAFFRRVKAGAEKAGFPKEKKYSSFKSLEYAYGQGCKLLPGADGAAWLRLMHVGEVRVHYHRPIPEHCRIKYIVVKQEKGGHWYATLQLEMKDRPLPEIAVQRHAAGIDVGLTYLLALSDGTVIGNPKWYREGQSKRRVLQRKLDRQRRANNPHNFNENGTVRENAVIWRKSNRERATEAQLRRLEDDIRQQRWYHWHTVTDALTRQYDFIALEALTLDFMQQNKRLSMSVYDSGIGAFWQMLEYKAQERGVTLVWVAPQYTSQTCSECGHVDAENRKTQSVFKCVACGHRENADVNAAKNILQRGIEAAVQTARDEIKANGSGMSRRALTGDTVATSGTPERAL